MSQRHTSSVVQQRQPAPVPGASTGTGSPSILVLEDDRATRLLLCATLSDGGYRVCEADRLQEARKLLAREPFDLIVLDGLLPDGTGLDFISEIRALDDRVELVFLSAFFRDYQTFQQLRGHLRVGELLRKPVTPDALLRVVQRLLATAPKAVVR